MNFDMFWLSRGVTAGTWSCQVPRASAGVAASQDSAHC